MYFVYIMSNQYNSTIYTGITNNLERRVYEHKNKLIDGFTNKYNLDKLVYFEHTANVVSAIVREKQIKGWKRMKKDNLINSVNLNWNDLSLEWYTDTSP